MDRLAILYEPSSFELRTKLMGRQSAGASFLKALAENHVNEIGCYTNTEISARQFATRLSELGSSGTKISWISDLEPQHLRNFGVLYRADPVLGQHAWDRLQRSHPQAYSICGITHTISTQAALSAMADYVTAPLESWDAIICTSQVARRAVEHVIEMQVEHLKRRVGATKFTFPQLPIIPLGIHTEQFRKTPEARAAARARFGLDDDHVVFLYAGRLSVSTKAHPLPMYLALEQAAQGHKVALIQAGTADNETVMKVITETSESFCPSVRNIIVVGSNDEFYRAAWMAADVFTSLSDNYQETFGLTPVEAMAAALPAVVSDWNGYKDTVRHGVDGFRVPTLAMPPGHGGKLADRYYMDRDDFPEYSAYTSQLVAVDITATAFAYRTLIDNPDLRSRMGAAAVRRARQSFDWRYIFPRYLDLWTELNERRRHVTSPAQPPGAGRRKPSQPDPFSVFSPFPSRHIGADLRIRWNETVTLDEALRRRMLPSTEFAKPVLPSERIVRNLFPQVGPVWTSCASVRQKLPEESDGALASAIIWLAKFGVLEVEHAAMPATEDDPLARPGTGVP